MCALVGQINDLTLYLFQKHLLYWEYEYIVYCSGIASVKVKFSVLLEFTFVKNFIASENLQIHAGYKTMFLKRREKVWSCVRCVEPLTSLPLHPRARRDQAIHLRYLNSFGLMVK